MAKKSMKNQPDLYHGDGNSTTKMPCKVKNMAGKTDPHQKNPGKLLPSKKVTEKGWSK